MNDKIKACCENCRFYTGKQCDTNGNWYDECSLYADDCSQPCEDFEIAKEARLKQRIAELEAENEKWRDAFGGRTPEEAKRDFDNIIQDLIDCKAGKRKEAIEIVANHISQMGKMLDIRKLVKPLVWECKEYMNSAHKDTDWIAEIGNLKFEITHIRACSDRSDVVQLTVNYNEPLFKPIARHFAGFEEIVIKEFELEEFEDATLEQINMLKQAAQDWLVSLVANACGLESEARK